MKEANEKLLTQLKAILTQYNVKMTIRQAYYRAVSQGIISNSQSSYNRVKRILKDARLNGKVNFRDIEDRTRKVNITDIKEETPEAYFNRYYDYLQRLDEYYRLPRWHGQPKRPVVLVEKQALEGIFKTVCDKCKVDLLVCRGYPSITVLWELGNTLRAYGCDEIDLLYFGDYDGSGLDIDRNVEDRLTNDFNVDFTFERIAITRDQITQYGIPPAPAKETDSRTRGMRERLGEAIQVELDAFDPPQLMKIIEDAIELRFDAAAWNDRVAEVEERRQRMKWWITDAFNPAFQQPKEGTK
jgi:hypothetical protein